MVKKNVRNSKLAHKFQELSFVKKNLILIFCCFLLLSLASVGYAAFNQALNITGDLTLRAVKDIRVTGVDFFVASSDGYEYNNNSFTTSTVSLSVVLPEANSRVAYQVTITNYSDKNMQLAAMNNTTDTTSAVCTVDGLVVGSVVPAGETVTVFVYVDGTGVESNAVAGALVEFAWTEYGGEVGPDGRYMAVCNNECVNGNSCSSNDIVNGVYCEVALVMSGSMIVVQDGGYIVNTNSTSGYMEIFMNTPLYSYTDSVFDSTLLTTIDNYTNYFTTATFSYDGSSYMFGTVSDVKARLPFVSEIANTQSEVYSWAYPISGSYLTGSYNPYSGTSGEMQGSVAQYVTSSGIQATTNGYFSSGINLRPVVRVYSMNAMGIDYAIFTEKYSEYLGKQF